MPFELTHLVVGLAVNPQANGSFLAGVIYPDVRYSAKIERRLTHTMEPLSECLDQEFVVGVKLHLETDKKWDELMVEIVKPNQDIPDNVFIGVLKLIHDRVVAKYITNALDVIEKLNQFQLPIGLPVTKTDWKEWIQNITRYVEEGPTRIGLEHVVIGAKFQNYEEIAPRLELVEQWYFKYEAKIGEIHQRLVNSLRSSNAGIT